MRLIIKLVVVCLFLFFSSNLNAQCSFIDTLEADIYVIKNDSVYTIEKGYILKKTTIFRAGLMTTAGPYSTYDYVNAKLEPIPTNLILKAERTKRTKLYNSRLYNPCLSLDLRSYRQNIPRLPDKMIFYMPDIRPKPINGR